MQYLLEPQLVCLVNDDKQMLVVGFGAQLPCLWMLAVKQLS